jgi:hypothetical protein
MRAPAPVGALYNVTKTRVDILTAQPADITELTQVEIESKRTSIPQLVDPAEIDLRRTSPGTIGCQITSAFIDRRDFG